MNVKALLRIIGNGQFMTVDFVDKAGNARTINGRTGVKKHLNPNAKKRAASKNKNLVKVFHRRGVINEGYKSIDSTRVKEIRANGLVIRPAK